MDTKINQYVVSTWASNIYDYNDAAINTLNEFKNIVNSLSNSYECTSSEAIIKNINSDLDNAVQTHTDMESFQAFLESVVKNAEDA